MMKIVTVIILAETDSQCVLHMMTIVRAIILVVVLTPVSFCQMSGYSRAPPVQHSLLAGRKNFVTIRLAIERNLLAKTKTASMLRVLMEKTYPEVSIKPPSAICFQCLCIMLTETAAKICVLTQRIFPRSVSYLPVLFTLSCVCVSRGELRDLFSSSSS